MTNDPSNLESYVQTWNGKPSVSSSKRSTYIPWNFHSIELTSVHGLSPSLIIYFNSSKFPSMKSSEAHSHILIELCSSFHKLVPFILPHGMPSTPYSNTPSDEPYLQPSYSTSLEESETPSIVLSDRPSLE